ncbi:hypothetical protein LCGC14_0791000 [marine sediment metagenome]|uniref:Uncharacterized protein n=1 Tax=marine sediment metagenome TaxID=412755 RepID=A0A0F9SZM0_9ZZZZ
MITVKPLGGSHAACAIASNRVSGAGIAGGAVRRHGGAVQRTGPVRTQVPDEHSGKGCKVGVG